MQSLFGIVPQALDGMYVSDKFPTYGLDEQIVHPGYLRWYFRSPQLWADARSMSTGSAALSKLTLNPPKFLRLPLPWRPLPDQERIAVMLDSLEVRVAELGKRRSNVKWQLGAMVKSTLGAVAKAFACAGRLEDVLVEKPRNGWSAKCDNVEGGTPVLSLGAVTGFQYQAAAIKYTSQPVETEARYWLNEGDLLITRSNTPELVGHAAIYSGIPNPCIYPDLMMKLELNRELVNPRFVWYWLQTPVVRDFIRSKARGTNPTMKKISQKDVMQIPFPTGCSQEAQANLIHRMDQLHGRLGEVTQHVVSSAGQETRILKAVLQQTFQESHAPSNGALSS